MKKTAALAIAAAAAALVAAAPPSLAEYVDLYPSDDLRGFSFLENPEVEAAVNSATFNETIRSAVLQSGVEGPISRSGSIIVSTGCEPHNCSSHQWTIAIIPKGGSAVCYHNQDLTGNSGRWFVRGRMIGTTPGCWSGSDAPVPDQVVLAMVKGS